MKEEVCVIIDRVNEVQAGIHICAIASLVSYVKLGLLVAALASVVESIPCTFRRMGYPFFTNLLVSATLKFVVFASKD